MLPEDEQIQIQEPPPEPAQQTFWSWVDFAWLIGILFLAFVGMTGITGMALYFHPDLSSSGPFLLSMQFILYGVLYFGFYFVFRVRHHRPVMDSLGWRPSTFGVWTSLGIGVLMAVAVEALTLLLKTPEKSPIEMFTNTTLSLILVSITAVGFAPFFEELLFRGFLQPLLTRDLGAIAGIVLTGCLFGALHLLEYGNVWQYGLAISLVGITLGYVRHRSGSVIPGTLVHACFNSIAVVGLIVSKYQKHP